MQLRVAGALNGLEKVDRLGLTWRRLGFFWLVRVYVHWADPLFLTLGLRRTRSNRFLRTYISLCARG